jgi:hypothetical protein
MAQAPADVNITGSLQGQVTLTPLEHPDERALRLRTIERQSIIEDRKGVAVFVVLLAAIFGIGCLAVYEAVIDPAATPDTRRWAQTVLTALVSGGISFVVGRKLGTR